MQISEIYLPQVGSSDELTYFLTYLYLFGDKCAKYQLRKISVFLMLSNQSMDLDRQCLLHLHFENFDYCRMGR